MGLATEGRHDPIELGCDCVMPAGQNAFSTRSPG